MKSKKILLLFIMSFLFIAGITITYARTYSDYWVNPYMYQVAPEVRGCTANLQTASSSCYANNTGVLFSGFQTLPTYYPYTSAQVTMYLFEEDPPGNDDERVKQYLAKYYDRECYDVTVFNLMGTSLIDSTGDQNCELYLDFVISGQVNGTPISNNIFTYRIFMD